MNRRDRFDDPGRRAGEDDHLADLVGIGLPPFQGPLAAFEPGGDRTPGDPVYLGGDLHAVHPEVDDRRPDHGRDPSLDDARITISGDEYGILEVTAVDGVWCLALHDELADAAPYLSLVDSEGRLRTWLLLPPPRLMIGIAHLWLPSVPLAAGSSPRGRSDR